MPLVEALELVTDQSAPRKRAVAVDIRYPETERWREILPEADDTQQQHGADAIGSNLSALPDPPPLSEPLELLSTRLPSSLRRSISDLTTALRARGDTRQSQKALPEQEVLAVLIWLAGDPDDPATIQRLGRALDTYRGRRYAAEARTLGS